ncbi:cystathionine beta-lyase [Chitinimonas sp. BJYL2]|uniref:cystathionine beta-lyase n=1 Tax=Chitinimonas sp. BJYL2 TaxID=2976696 RepID=UPI0022B598ED|nr:cystathionine beta-lyase [Chitinimonas sp. BJYL2]
MHDHDDLPATRLTHRGRNPKSEEGTVNPAVVRASTMLFPNADSLRKADGTRRSYGRHATDTTLALEDALCAAEQADACLLTPSGLSAITTTLLALLQPGDHLLMTDSAYDPTRLFCEGLLKRMGISTSYYDPLIGAGIAALIQPNTRVVWVESPGSHTFEVQDVPAIAAAAHAAGALVVADSTWATPLGWDVFALGVDVSVHAATKYIVGHSDVLMGAILCKSPLEKTLRATYRQLGVSIGGDDAYLALRGLRTLAARLTTHRDNSRQVADWLREQPQVASVLYPPLPGAPGHDLYLRDFNPAYACGLFGVVFAEGTTAAQVNKLVDATRLFGIGYSWGGYESLIIPSDPGSHRAVTSERWRGKAMVRLHIGLEDPADLIADLAAGLVAMKA